MTHRLFLPFSVPPTLTTCESNPQNELIFFIITTWIIHNTSLYLSIPNQPHECRSFPQTRPSDTLDLTKEEKDSSFHFISLPIYIYNPGHLPIPLSHIFFSISLPIPFLVMAHLFNDHSYPSPFPRAKHALPPTLSTPRLLYQEQNMHCAPLSLPPSP